MCGWIIGKGDVIIYYSEKIDNNNTLSKQYNNI